jgi:hypothetical protein
MLRLYESHIENDLSGWLSSIEFYAVSYLDEFIPSRKIKNKSDPLRLIKQTN